MSRRTTILGVLTTLLVAALVWVPAGAASAATLLTESNSLPLARYADHAIDTSRERIFITPGPGGDRLAVTDLRGELVDSRAGLPGAQAVALSADGTTLFVSLETGQVVELDPDSLDTRATHAVTTSTQPVIDLAWADGKLWVLGSRPYNQAALSTLDRDTGSLVPTGVAVGGRTLAATPTGVLVRKDMNDVVLSVGASGVIAERTFGWNVEVGSSTTGQTFVRDASPDPRIIVVDPATLETVRTTTLPQSAFATTDGNLAASAADHSRHHEVAVVDAATSRQLNIFRVPYRHWEDAPYVTGLVLGPEGLVVLAEAPEGVTTWHEPVPGTPGTQVRLDVPDPSWIGRTTVVTGTLEDEGAPVGGAELTVTDRIWFNEGLQPRTRTLTTAADGSFSFDYVPRAWGETFLVEYEGDGVHPPLIEEIDFSFHHQTTALEVNRPAAVAPGEPISFTGSLTALGDPLPDAAVLVEQTCTGTERPFEVVTDEAGRFTVDVVPGRCVEPIFRFSFGSGSLTYEPVSTTRAVPVSWVRSTLVVAQPRAEAPIGSTLTWTGRLTRGTNPAPFTPVSFTLRRDAGPAAATGTVLTDELGDFSIEQTIAYADRYSMTVAYAGDDTTLGTSSSHPVTITPYRTAVMIDDPYVTALPDEAITVSGLVRRDDGTPVPDHPLEFVCDGVDVGVGETGGDGRFEFTAVPRPPRDQFDDYQRVCGVIVVADSRHATSDGSVWINVRHLPTRLVLDDISSPSQPGDVVALAGRLSTTDGSPLAGETVTLVHEDGETDTYTTTTDANGVFSVDTTIATGRWQRLTATFDGTSRLARAVETQEWAASGLPGTLTLEPVSTRLVNELVRLEGRLSDKQGVGDRSMITITRTSSGGGGWVYDPVETSADGTFAIEVPAEQVGRFTFTARSSLWRVAPQTASIVVNVRTLRLTARAVRPNRIADGWSVYDAVRDPRILSSTTPPRAGMCLSHEVEILRDGRWRDLATTECRETGADGSVRAVLDVPHPAGTRLRVRPLHDVEPATRGDWVKIRFR